MRLACATIEDPVGDLTITGAGKLTAKGKDWGVGSNGNMTVVKGTLAISGATPGAGPRVRACRRGRQPGSFPGSRPRKVQKPKTLCWHRPQSRERTMIDTDERRQRIAICSYMDVSELDDPTIMAQARESLPWPERRERALRFRFAKDQRLCIGAGLLAAHMLQQAGAADLTLAYGEHGKPYLLHHPSIHFNLSHSGTLAVCAVDDAPLGVDVEVVHDHDAAVAEYCFQPEELAWLDQAPDRARAFTRLWVRKESYIKLTGTGLSREPGSFSVLPDSHMLTMAEFAEFDMEDALICVCTHDKREVNLIRWSPLEVR